MTIELLFTVLGLCVTVLLSIFGVVFKRINTMDNRLRHVPSRQEVERLIDNKQEGLKILQAEIKEDIKEVRLKIDALFDKIVSGPKS